MEFLAAASLLALGWKVVDFLRNLVNLPSTKSAVVTQLTAWIAGVAVVMLAAQTTFAGGINFGDAILGNMNAWDQAFVGLGLLSLGGVGVDVKKAIDNTDTAAVPPLIPTPPPDVLPPN